MRRADRAPLTKRYQQSIVAEVDLEKILKYHPASKLFYTEAQKQGNPNKYSTKITFVYRTNKKDLIDSFHPAYNLLNIDERELSDYHLFNLMFLVQSLISIEWNFYQNHLLDNNDSKDFTVTENSTTFRRDFWSLAKNELQSLLRLLELRDIAGPSAVTLSLNFESSYTKNKSYLINNDCLINEILEKEITLLFEKVKDTPNPILKELISNVEKPTFEEIRQIHDSLPELFKYERAFTLFQNLVVDKVLHYLNTETDIITPPNETMTAEQARIIYPLLCSFGLVIDKLIEKHTTDRSRINYARSIITNPKINSANSKSKKQPKQFLQVKVG